MNKIGIIAGGGKLPLAIGKSLLKSKFQIKFLCIENFCDLNNYKNYDFVKIKLNSLSKIIKILKENEIKKILMAGHVKRPSIKDINFDFSTIKLIKNYALDSKGDDKLLKAISIFFENHGINVFDWKKKCNDLFIDEDLLTNIKPSKAALLNKNKGLEIFNIIGKADISQSMIIQNKIILGLEAAEGTDELIFRCSKYKKKGDKGILLKLSKYKQDSNLDIPVIGLNTVMNLKKNNFEGVFLEKNKCIIIDKSEVIKYSNQNRIFIASVKKK